MYLSFYPGGYPAAPRGNTQKPINNSVQSQPKFGKILALEGRAQEHIQGSAGNWTAFDPEFTGKQHIFFMTPTSRQLIEPDYLRRLSDITEIPFAKHSNRTKKDIFAIIETESGRLLRAFIDDTDIWLVNRDGEVVDVETADPALYAKLNERLKKVEQHLVKQADQDFFRKHGVLLN